MKHADDGSTQYGFLFNQSRCTGCKTCQIACADYHHLPTGVFLRSVYEYTGGEWTQDRNGCWNQDVFGYFVSLSCNHCSDPVCMRFCTVNALVRKPDGTIQLVTAKCTCCQTCMLVCPYYAPRFNYQTGLMVKCNACEERRLQGNAPICVEACPTRALSFGLFDELCKNKSVSYAVAPMSPSNLSQPNYAILPCSTAKPVDDMLGFVTNIHEA